jgi:RNase P subunit RPR2
MFEKSKVYETKIVKVAKNHECVKCGIKIWKGDNARNTTYSYDDRLISLYICTFCNVGF